MLRAKSLAVIGGGAWCASVITQCQAFGFSGPIWPVHPDRSSVAGLSAYRSIGELPHAPDAAFVGVNRHASIDVVRALCAQGAGGAVCFASGFAEAAAELDDGTDLQTRLVASAGTMPILGPNCYGFLNAFDQIAVWPDQHGLKPVERGVAILTQSSNIAINLTMNTRALPIGYVITCGNMAQRSQAAIAHALLEDPRVTAIGLHVEGFTDLRVWETLAQEAHAKGIALIALKTGMSVEAQRATISHTAALAGEADGARALMRRLGMVQVETLPVFLEALKLAHSGINMDQGTLATISCSGGEASLAADLIAPTSLRLPPLNAAQIAGLSNALGPKVALANPLDYHTYIWRDTAAMARCFGAMQDPGLDLSILIVDYPTGDASDWRCATEAAIAARRATGQPLAVAATLPELLPEETSALLLHHSVIPLHGLSDAIAALAALHDRAAPSTAPLLLSSAPHNTRTLLEDRAKPLLAAYGVPVPRAAICKEPGELAEAARALEPPLALKALGHAHKSDTGGVKLGLTHHDLTEAARGMGEQGFLVEEMIREPVAELIVGVLRDPAHGHLLSIGAGGVLAEIMQDNIALLIPAAAEEVEDALRALKSAPLLTGYRGKPPADMGALVAAIMAVQRFVIAHKDAIEEVEINPLIVTATGAWAADALIQGALDTPGN